MTPDQREAALRLADALSEFDSMCAQTGLSGQAADLLRELAVEPVLASTMRSPDGGPRFRVQESGKWIDDDDFIFDALLRIDGDFGDSRLAYAQWIADALNAADERLPDRDGRAEPVAR